MHLLQKTFQGQALRFLKSFGLEMEAVQRIEKNAVVTLPSQSTGSAKEIVAPGGCIEIHDLTVPGTVSDGAGSVLQAGRGEITMVFTDRQVSEHRAALGLEISEVGSGDMSGLNNHPLELRQLGERRLIGVPESYAGGLGKCCTSEKRNGQAEKPGYSI